MNAARAVSALGPADARSIVRDPLLRWMVFYPLAVALLVRWLAAPMTARVLAVWGLDVTPYYPLVVSFLLILGPMLTGMVVGFLLLDQRDDGTLAALSVTPLTWRGYLAYRLAMPTAVSIPVAMATVWLTGLNTVAPGPLLACAVVAAPFAPLLAVFLAAFAGNKVQGFALVKAQGGLLILPVLAWWVAMPWQLLFGVVPPYWPAKLYWVLSAGESGAWAYLLLGLAWQAALLAALLRRFDTVAGR